MYNCRFLLGDGEGLGVSLIAGFFYLMFHKGLECQKGSNGLLLTPKVCCGSLLWFRSKENFSDCLKVKLFLPLFVSFYDQQGILGAYSSQGAEAHPLNPQRVHIEEVVHCYIPGSNRRTHTRRVPVPSWRLQRWYVYQRTRWRLREEKHIDVIHLAHCIIIYVRLRKNPFMYDTTATLLQTITICVA